MDYKVLEESPKRLSILINNHKKLAISIALIFTGILIAILAFHGAVPSLLASITGIPKDSLAIGCYIASILALVNGVYGLASPIDSTLSFDKARQQLSVQRRNLFGSNTEEFPLNEVTGVELLRQKNISELVIWIRKNGRFRGTKIELGKSNSDIKLLISRRIISDFLSDQPIQLLHREWVIHNSEDTLAVCHTSGNYRKYSIKKHEKILVCELDGKEISRFDINQIVDIQIEDDKSDEEHTDRIILIMKTGEKEPISNYMDSYGMNASGHEVVVRALRYSLGL
ncbi:MAG: hypothetical protein DCF19_19410 [Pseudanabaena frigida]|uniref:Uncharacterized protein n=1 Tax=Pseudanabaena frigida TaxID=945775 RepID=A0A2W4VXR4_9CYAN|nr:MAG: hypothetical protein DCF19_19410 [Pseudanabaena frigida]